MAQNNALLEIAGVLKAIRAAIVNGEAIAYNREEAIVVCVQAAIQVLCGGAPSSLVLPKIGSPAALNDPAVVRFTSGSITPTPFIPGGPNTTTATNVAADGTAAPISFATPFPNQCTQVFCNIRDYNGTDNAALTFRVVTNSLTTTGFTVVVGGGQPGTTVSLDYFPVGE